MTRSRRGIALLIVLATTVSVAAAASLLVRGLTLERAHHSISLQEAIALDALKSAEEPIRAWLGRASQRVVLTPDTASPQVRIVDDDWPVAHSERTLDCSLHITAFDQLGMIPTAQAADAMDELLAASHNPPRPGDSTRININTAPRDVLEELLPRSTPNALRSILTTRRQGTSASPAGLAASPIRFTTRSNVWSFRIDVSVGRVHRSWREVWHNTGSQWRRIQRNAITD